MAKTSLAVLESALRERKLDRTLSSAVRAGEAAEAGCTPTTVAPLDACLRGGLPRGQLCEVAGAHGSGRTTLALQLLAGVTRQGEMAALVDTNVYLSRWPARRLPCDETSGLSVIGSPGVTGARGSQYDQMYAPFSVTCSRRCI